MPEIVHPLVSFRKRHDPQLSQGDFASKAKVEPMTVYRWEAGRTMPRAKQMPLLVKLTGISSTEFYAAYQALQDKRSRSRKRAA